MEILEFLTSLKGLLLAILLLVALVGLLIYWNVDKPSKDQARKLFKDHYGVLDFIHSTEWRTLHKMLEFACTVCKVDYAFASYDMVMAALEKLLKEGLIKERLKVYEAGQINYKEKEYILTSEGMKRKNKNPSRQVSSGELNTKTERTLA